jgi:hypothetical protein
LHNQITRPAADLVEDEPAEAEPAEAEPAEAEPAEAEPGKLMTKNH